MENILNERSLNNLNSLQPHVREKVIEAFTEVYNRTGIQVLIYSTLRTNEEQAKLWRQSRSSKQIKKKIAWYNKIGREDLGEVLNNIGPQYGKHVTNACAGESMHNFGLALDYAIYYKGNLDWKSIEKYQLVGKILSEFGFNCGVFWRGGFKDSVHIQLTENLKVSDLLIKNERPTWWEEKSVIA